MTHVNLLRMTRLNVRCSSILNATIDRWCLCMRWLISCLLQWCLRDIGNVTCRATLHLGRWLSGPWGSGRAGSLRLVLILWGWVSACCLEASLVGRDACGCAELAMLASRQHIDSQDLTSIWPIEVSCRRPTFLLMSSCVWIQISALDVVTSWWASPSIWTPVHSAFCANSLPCSAFTSSMCICVTLVGQTAMALCCCACEWPIVWVGWLLLLGLVADVTSHCCVRTVMIGATSLIHSMMVAAAESILTRISRCTSIAWDCPLCVVKSSWGFSRLKLCDGLSLRGFRVFGCVMVIGLVGCCW